MAHRIFIGRLSDRARHRDIEKFCDKIGHYSDIIIKQGFAFVDFDEKDDADDAVYELNGREICGQRVVVEKAKGTDRTKDRSRSRSRSRSRRKSRSRSRSRRRSRSRSQRSRSNRRQSPSRSRGRGGGGRAPSGRGMKFGPPIRTEWEVRIENLSSRISWQDLKDECRKYGEVTYADAHKQEKNIATVCFDTRSDMKYAIKKMDGTKLHERRIKMISNTGSRSRSRSGSRSSRNRSRSKSRSSRSRSKSKSRSRSNSKSKSPSKERSKSPGKEDKEKSKSKSKSKSRSPSRSSSKSR